MEDNINIISSGHPMAAGLTLRREHLPLLEQRMNENARLTEEQLTEKLWIDLALPFSYSVDRKSVV